MPYIKLNHEVVHAQYDEPTGKWHVRVRKTDQATGAQEEIEDVADVLVTAIGPLGRWKMPDIEGIADFKGELHHTAGYRPSGKTWKDDLERWKGKRIGVIGSVSDVDVGSAACVSDECGQGSTAIQVVTALAPHASKLANYVRGQTWLSPPFAMSLFAELLGREPSAPENESRL